MRQLWQPEQDVGGWVKLWECDKLLYAKRLVLRLNVAVYKSYARPVILYRIEVW